MSLGPPFDASGERAQYGVGAATVIIVLAAVAIALLASDRSLGESITLRVRMRSPGALRNGAHVQMAGRQVGEVVAIRGVGWMVPAPRPGGPIEARDGRGGVELEVRLLRTAMRHVHRNSSFFSHSDNVLTEPTLEIGPPARGVEPDRLVEDGETVRGADPADMDRLLEEVHGGLTAILDVAHELQPDWDAFRGAFSGLFVAIDAVAEPGVVARLMVQGERALDAAERLQAALRQADAPDRVVRLAGELGRALDQMGPDLKLVGGKLGALDDQLRGLTAAFGPQQRRQLDEAVAQFRRAIAAAERLGEDLRWMARYVEDGRGTLGGFQQDLQIFDELKETHRLIKRESWKLLLKGKDRGQRDVR
jgi:hypothetical protein